MIALKDYARTVDLASRQDGIVTRQQLLRWGVHPSSIPRMLADETVLQRLGRGVYDVPAVFDMAFGLDPFPGFLRADWEALCPDLMTAEKRDEATAISIGVFSHYTASQLHGTWDLPDDLHVTCPTSRRVDGYTVHVAPVDPAEVVWIDGLPVTSLERTTYDLGHMEHIDGEHRARWMRDMVKRHGWTIERVCQVMGPVATEESLWYFEEKMGLVA